MSYYFAAQIRISDDEEYKKYLDSAENIFRKYNGKYLAVDNNPTILEGNWNYTRSVLIKFDSKEDFYCWYNSDEYQNILKHRLKGAKCDSILIEGLNNA